MNRTSIATHTPGPWRVGELYHNKIAINADHAPYGFVGEVNGGGPVCEANARLIAAAPDILAALREMADDIEARWDMRDRSTNPGIKHCVEQARAAIAKAEAQDDTARQE